MTMGSDGKRISPAEQAAERDLDRMLDLVAPPAPSDTLRARLKRDFAPAANARPSAGSVAARLFRERAGAFAVAAALTLAVALGVTMPGGPGELQGVSVARLDDGVTTLAALYGVDALGEDVFLSDEDLFALEDDGTDSATFMLAVFDTTASTGYDADFAFHMPLD